VRPPSWRRPGSCGCLLRKFSNPPLLTVAFHVKRRYSIGWLVLSRARLLRLSKRDDQLTFDRGEVLAVFAGLRVEPKRVRTRR
jgi:hypothetical protein